MKNGSWTRSIVWTILILLTISINVSLFVTNSNLPAMASMDDDISSLSNKNELSVRPTSQGPTIGTPILNNSNPGIAQAVKVSALVTDPDGIDNATLFWEYQTLNNTVFNATMNEGKTTVVDETTFAVYNGTTGAIDGTHNFGNFSYEASAGEILTEIDVSITKGQGNNDLTYVKIESKNSSTGDWEIEHEVGNPTSTTDLVTVTFTSNKPVAGYRIYAISYRLTGGGPKDPVFNYLRIYQSGYTGVIAGTNQPTIIGYFIQAFDQSGSSTTSPTYTFQVGSGPAVTIENPPASINGTQDLVLNVTVSDVDGVGDINKSSAIAYYRLAGNPNWSSVSLTYLHDLFDGLTAEFTGTIPSSNLANQETVLHVMVNCSDSLGLEGSSGDQPITVDSLAPRVTGIIINGGVVGLENVTLISSEVNITATFDDLAGISSVSIYYSIPNNTAPIKKLMVNSSDIGPAIAQSSFEITLPAANETAFVGYFFETQDHFGNLGNTSVNTYYADGIGPLLAAIEVFPQIITNNTNVAILFNASDYSEVSESVVWYSYDNGITWASDTAALIDYGNEITYQETFKSADVPFLIADQETSHLTLEVARGAKVDQAVLSIGFTHDQSTDLRIWLNLQDGRRFLVFDREAGPIDNTLTVDLFSLGLNQSDFSESNFTLEIQDFSDQYSGSITAFQIELIHYRYPLGFEYVVAIPSSENDTTVIFYLTLTDLPLNAENTSIFSYYADGIPPEISIPAEQLTNGTLDLAGAAYLQITANATDQGGISSVEVYYRFSENASWQIAAMDFDAELNLYSYSVPLPQPAGTLTYKIRAFDRSGLTAQSSEHTIQFTNGEIAPSPTSEDNSTVDKSDEGSGSNGNLLPLLFLGILAMLGLGAIGGALIYFYSSKIKSKTP